MFVNNTTAYNVFKFVMNNLISDYICGHHHSMELLLVCERTARSDCIYRCLMTKNKLVNAKYRLI